MTLKVGLLRHLRPPVARWRLLNAVEFLRWWDEYDRSGIEARPVDLNGVQWERCYSSDLPRAVGTARSIFRGQISLSPLLREVPVAPVWPSRLPLPWPVWILLGRVAWYCEHSSQPEPPAATARRARAFVTELLRSASVDTLIVTHGLMMKQIAKELIRRGFRGHLPLRPLKGRLYLFTAASA